MIQGNIMQLQFIIPIILSLWEMTVLTVIGNQNTIFK